MIRDYIVMKRNELKVKATIYSMAAYFIDNQKDFINIMQKLYESLKDVPGEQFRSELVAKLAEIVHEENQNK